MKMLYAHMHKLPGITNNRDINKRYPSTRD